MDNLFHLCQLAASHIFIHITNRWLPEINSLTKGGGTGAETGFITLGVNDIYSVFIEKSPERNADPHFEAPESWFHRISSTDNRSESEIL